MSLNIATGAHEDQSFMIIPLKKIALCLTRALLSSSREYINKVQMIKLVMILCFVDFIFSQILEIVKMGKHG